MTSLELVAKIKQDPAVSPVVDEQRDSYAYCDFASVCGFDRGAVRTRRRRDGLPGREAVDND